jgi:diguanylate cyclase (GGDEF)-like protein
VYNGKNARLQIGHSVMLDLLRAKGPPSLAGGTLRFGRWIANGDTSLVDRVRRVAGTDATLLAVIGGKPIRVATTVESGGARHLGTELRGPARAAFDAGRDFTGINPILGRNYLNHYSALRDRSGKIVAIVDTSVPLAMLYGAEWRMMRWVVLGTVIALTMSFILLYVVMRPLRHAFAGAIAMAYGLAAGEVDQQSHAVTSDEIGEVHRAFEQMIRYQQHMAAIADAIARGDFSADVTPVSERDRLGVAIAAMSRNLADLMAQLEASAMTDSLTQLGNRRAFDQKMQSELSRIARHGGSLSLALIDVDHFKGVNDRYGHQHGDGVLSALAGVLRSTRAEDAAYRLGGDEFAVILVDTNAADAKLALERVRQAAQSELLGTTVTIGIGTSLEGFIDSEGVRRQADAALYVGKQRGRNIVVIFDEAQCRLAVPGHMNVHAVSRLIEDRQLNVHFQPIWDVRSATILGFEALARPQAEYGLAGPQEAFDVAAKIGRAHDLDRVCREAAIARCREMPDGALLFLNVSPETLARGGLGPNELIASIEAAGLRPERVVLEVTERFDGPPDPVIAAAALLQRAGFKLALDDTGAGNAGLEYLGRLRADFIKIDAAIIASAATDPAARGMLAAIVAFAAMTGGYVIAEGIEDQTMLDMVRQTDHLDRRTAHQVHGVQGYYLGRPAPTFSTLAAFSVASQLRRKAAIAPKSYFIAT